MDLDQWQGKYWLWTRRKAYLGFTNMFVRQPNCCCWPRLLNSLLERSCLCSCYLDFPLFHDSGAQKWSPCSTRGVLTAPNTTNFKSTVLILILYFATLKIILLHLILQLLRSSTNEKQQQQFLDREKCHSALSAKLFVIHPFLVWGEAVRMGLAENKIKQRLSADPNNLAWSNGTVSIVYTFSI